MSFKEEVAKLEARLLNSESITESQKISNTVFSEGARKEIEYLAKGLGVQSEVSDFMFEYVVTAKGNKFLAGPSIIGSGEMLFVKWHSHKYQFVKDEDYDYQIDVKEGNFPVLTLKVTYVYDIETEAKVVDHSFRFRLKNDVKLPEEGILRRQFKTNPHSLAKYCQDEAPINSLKDAPDTFTVTGVRTLKKGDGSDLYVLDTDFGSYWGTDQCEGLEVPILARVEGDKVVIPQTKGDVEISFSSFGKMRDLQVGDYKCTDYKRQTSDLYGEQVMIKLEDGKWYNANSTVTKVINAFEPKITSDKPAILKVQDKKILKTGNTKVICQFVIGEQEDDDFDKSFGNWLNSTKEEVALPF